MDKLLNDVYTKYDTNNLFKDYSSVMKKSKKNKPVYIRTEFLPDIKCQVENCVKISCFKNMVNDRNICWFHAYTLNE